MKKHLCLLLALTMVFCLFATASPLASATGDPEVVLRYVITSDIHNHFENIGPMLQTTYDYAQTQDYKGIDAVIVNGDAIDNQQVALYEELMGTFATEFGKLTALGCDEPELIMTMGNHDNKVVETTSKTCREVFEEQTGFEPDHDYNVKGYHFITLSSSSGEGNYTDAQFQWLDGRLAAAKDEDADKPIMFMIHEPMKYTIYGTETGSHSIAYSTERLNILNKYPQLIMWTSHTHIFLNHQRGIWQSDAGWTEVATGQLRNFGRSWDTLPIIGDGNEKGFGGDVKMEDCIFSIVEILSDNSTVVKHSTLSGHMFAEQWKIGEGYDNTPDGRANAEVAPQFSSGAVIDCTAGTDSVAVAFPQDADIENTEYYEVSVTPAAGGETKSVLLSSEYWKAAPSATLFTTISGLAKGTEYTLNVYPVGFYGKKGTPLNESFTTVRTLKDDLDVIIDGTIAATDANGNAVWTGDTSYISGGQFVKTASDGKTISIKSVNDYDLGNQFVLSFTYTRSDSNCTDGNYAYIGVGDIGLAIHRAPNPNSKGDLTCDSLAICYGYDMSAADDRYSPQNGPFSEACVIKRVDFDHVAGDAEYTLTYDNGHVYASKDGVKYVDVSADELADVIANPDFSSVKLSLKAYDTYAVKPAGFTSLELYADAANMDTVSYNGTEYTLTQVNNIIDGLVVDGKIVANQATIELATALYNALASYQIEKINAEKLVFVKTVLGGIAADVNNDGSVNALDYTNVSMLVLDMIQLDSITSARCDVNHNGVTDSADALAVKCALLNITVE